MKILILTSSHPYVSAGIIAKDILTAFADTAGNEVKIVTKAFDNYHDNRIIPINTKFGNISNIAYRLFNRTLKRLLILLYRDYKNREEKIKVNFNKDFIFEYPHNKTYYSSKRILRRAKIKPDIIIILFTTGFLSFKNIFELNQITKSPVFIYPMDMISFTGGCHYAWNCTKYTTICGMCPAINSNILEDLSYKNYQYKLKYIEISNLEIIAGTEYLYQQLTKSSLFRHKSIIKLLLPVDNNIFKPAKRQLIRNKLGLPIDKKIIFIGSVILNEKRKGVQELIEALNYLYNKLDKTTINNIYLVFAGRHFETIENIIPFNNKFLGFLSINELANVFQASDIFLNSSIEDSGPLMINQSIMCGTPVVSFEMGVSLDLVITGKTGYRAKLMCPIDLANGIAHILKLNKFEYNKMSANCRALGISLCHPKKHADKIIEIFNSKANLR
jgi:glycosyltransferase involved in cell wall biosynthesis